jgi:hypothetical protein
LEGGVVVNRHGHMTVAATLQKSGLEEDDSWGHSTSEVAQLTSTDGGGSFSFQLVSEPDEKTAHWLPSIERPTGHNGLPDRPGSLYTAGPPGKGLKDILSNGVYWVG